MNSGSSSSAQSAKSSARFTPYHWKLFIFLSVATFFEGYDFMALTQLLPNFGAEWELGEAQKGALVTVINLGTVAAYVLVRRADRWGRKRVLTVTIVGYTVFTFLTGFAPNVYVFGALQLVARVFLVGEYAISMVIAAEEFPAARRGNVIGVILAFNSLGAIVCAGVVPTLLETSLGWRAVYFVGVIPLAIIAMARRGLRETERFSAQVGLARTSSRGLFHIFKTPHRTRVLQMAAIWFLTYICTHNAVTFWKEFALAERGLTDAEAGGAIALAAVAAMPLVFLSGRLMDGIGRRLGAVVIFLVGSLGVVACYTVEGRWPLTAALVFGIYGASAVPQVLNAYTTELFPTDLRGDAFAWSNNLLGRIGYVFSPAAVGLAAGSIGWGLAVSVTTIFQLAALVLILLLLPETKGRELEETAAV